MSVKLFSMWAWSYQRLYAHFINRQKAPIQQQLCDILWFSFICVCVQILKLINLLHTFHTHMLFFFFLKKNMCCFLWQSFKIQTCYHYYTTITHSHKGRTGEDLKLTPSSFASDETFMRPTFKLFFKLVDELDTFLKCRAVNMLHLPLYKSGSKRCVFQKKKKKLSPTPPTDCLLAQNFTGGVRSSSSHQSILT